MPPSVPPSYSFFAHTLSLFYSSIISVISLRRLSLPTPTPSYTPCPHTFITPKPASWPQQPPPARPIRDSRHGVLRFPVCPSCRYCIRRLFLHLYPWRRHCRRRRYSLRGRPHAHTHGQPFAHHCDPCDHRLTRRIAGYRSGLRGPVFALSTDSASHPCFPLFTSHHHALNVLGAAAAAIQHCSAQRTPSCIHFILLD